MRCSWYPAQTGSGVPHKQTPHSTKPAGSDPGGCPVSLQITAIKGLLRTKNLLHFSLSGPGLCRDERAGGNLPPKPSPTSFLSGGNSSAQPSPRAQGKTVTKQQQSAHEQKNEKKGKYRHGILMGQHGQGQMRGGGTRCSRRGRTLASAWLCFGAPSHRQGCSRLYFRWASGTRV